VRDGVDRVLAVGMGKCNTFGTQAVEVGRADGLVAEGMNGVITLLICTDPEDVWLVGGHCETPFYNQVGSNSCNQSAKPISRRGRHKGSLP